VKKLQFQIAAATVFVPIRVGSVNVTSIDSSILFCCVHTLSSEANIARMRFRLKRASCATLASLGCALGMLGTVMSSFPVHADSLRSVVQRAIDDNPELGAMRYNRRAIDQELQAALGLSLPKLDLDARAGVGYGNADGGDPRWNSEAGSIGLTLRQNLYDGNESRSEQGRQGDRVLSARSRVADAANSVALKTVQSFLEVQRSSRVVGIARKNVEAHKAIIARLRLRIELGGGVTVDETVARGRLEATRSFVAEAEATSKDAQTMFRAVTGFAPGKLDPVRAPVKAMPRSLNTAVAEAKRIAPSVAAALADTRVADGSVGTAKARLLPRLDAEVSTRARFGDFDERFARAEASAMLVLRQNLFDGGMNDARVEEAQERAFEARQNLLNSQRIVEREVRFAWTAIEKGRSRSAAMTRQLDRNREAYAGYLDQFELGERGLLDLLDMQNEIFILETNLVTEEFAARYSTFRVIAAVGRLLPALGIAVPIEGVWGNEEPVRREIERRQSGAIPKGGL
jgi:outer membrane protein, adhesin transport system